MFLGEETVNGQGVYGLQDMADTLNTKLTEARILTHGVAIKRATFSAKDKRYERSADQYGVPSAKNV